jgi:hypothetical protein
MQKLVCRVEEVTLDNPPKFYALSYTWGKPGATLSIFCNWGTMEIATNLHEAMVTLFSEPRSLDLPIWIDAICINQRRRREGGASCEDGGRGRKATKVVVWLGPGTARGDLAIDFLDRLGQALKKVPHHPELNEHQHFGLPDQYRELWPALGHLFRRK